MESLTEKDLTQYASDKLRAHFENDSTFLEEFMETLGFYSLKFHRFFKTEEDLKEFNDALYQMSKSQIFQGYYLMLEIIHDEGTDLPAEFFNRPDGYIRQDAPMLLRQALGDALKDVVKTDNTQKFTMWLIKRFEDVYDLIDQTIYDLASLGSFQALLDERAKRNITLDVEPQEMLLGDAGDLIVLNPQIQMVATGKSDTFESWVFQFWSTHTNSDKIGEVVILSFLDSDKLRYLLNIQIHESISEIERESMVEKISILLAARNDVKKEDIQIQLAVVKDFYLLSL